jgi:predicted transposase YbfD/YdcC
VDLTHDNSLMAYLRTVPDPRGRRGRSFEWWFLLAVLTAAIAAGQQSVRGIADWVKAREEELVLLLGPRCGRVPSLSTLERVLWRVGRTALEQALAAHAAAHVAAHDAPRAELLEGLALDGKVQRGVGAHGGSLCLVSLVCHGSGLVLGQTAVPDKTNEITAAPVLLTERNLRGRVLTVDALHCQRELAELVIARGGHYLMALKGNQPTLYEAVVELFGTRPTRRFQPVQSRTKSAEKSHGRYEERWLETSVLLNDYLDWPGLAQVLRRRCRRTFYQTGKVEEETTYFITSLPLAQARAKQLTGLIRGHWTIENKLHHVRDVSFREDACGARTGSAAQALAALHNGVLNVLRLAGRTNIAQALRYNAAYTANALACIGALPT